MTTVANIITRALRLLNVYGTGETLSADESVDGMTALNALIDEWATESLMSNVKKLDVIPLVAGTSVYTIGTTGTVVSPRPESIDPSSYILKNGVSYPTTIASLSDYNSIVSKDSESDIPYALWYKADYPNGTLTVYPTPSDTADLYLWSIKPVEPYTALTDVVAFPPAYQNAITYNLAVALAPEYNQQILPAIMKTAVTAKKKIKRANYEPIVLESRVTSRRYFDIGAGE